MDPAVPTLEQLWEGRVEITLRGPTGRQVRCNVSLHDTDTGAATVTKQLPPIALPVTPDGWRRHFEKHFQETRQAPLVYDTARVCEIEFTAEELGAFTVRCEREFTPLRWAVRRHGQRHIARLLDDSGDPNPRQVACLAFETPCIEEPLCLSDAYEASGGLYVARQGELTAAVIVPPSVRGLADLRCAPRIDGRGRSTDSVLRFVAIARLWARARLPGDLFSAIRQRDVLHALALHIFRLIGGDNWALAELSASTGANGFAELRQAVSRRSEEVAIGAAIADESGALAAATCDERVVRIASLATSFHLISFLPPQEFAPGVTVISRGKLVSERDPMWLSELALRLASDPGGVEAWAGEKLRAGMTRLLEVPTLARAARFLVLATDRHLQSPRAAPGELYAGWGWT
jgi:hypothetical protein